MNLFDVLSLIGGLCLFLFGMNIMGQALERRAGNSLETLLSKLTSGRIAGFLTGLAVTAVVQSSSATTVMVVGFVNSGLMSLKQAINVIMGANVGTTVTAWILSLGGISSDNVIVQLFKPTSFTPVLALIGIAYFMFGKNNKKKDTGMILLGFATLMFGMDTMSGAVSGLRDVPAFQQLFIAFKNPVLGVLAGAVLTGIIQSSSASVGILQSLSMTGAVSIGAAIPIIMGQNIGTCVTAMLSSAGTNRNARRAAFVHLMFNIIGTAVWLAVFWIVRVTVSPAIFDEAANTFNIAICHSIFNVLCTVLLLPMSGLLEKIANMVIPEAKGTAVNAELDERLLASPAVALERCRTLTGEMADAAVSAMTGALQCLDTYDAAMAERVREDENRSDHYEDLLGTYLVKLSAQSIDEDSSSEAAGLLKLIGDFERIADHSINILESAEELREKELSFTADGKTEMMTLTAAVSEVLRLSMKAYADRDLAAAHMVQPLEEVVDDIKEQLRTRHILRLQKGTCSIEVGFVWADLLNNLERVSDHCANIASCLVDMDQKNMNMHATKSTMKPGNPEFDKLYAEYSEKYTLPAAQ